MPTAPLLFSLEGGYSGWGVCTSIRAPHTGLPSHAHEAPGLHAAWPKRGPCARRRGRWAGCGLQSIVGIVMNLNFCQIWPNIMIHIAQRKQMHMTVWAEKYNK